MSSLREEFSSRAHRCAASQKKRPMHTRMSRLSSMRQMPPALPAKLPASNRSSASRDELGGPEVLAVADCLPLRWRMGHGGVHRLRSAENRLYVRGRNQRVANPHLADPLTIC